MVVKDNPENGLSKSTIDFPGVYVHCEPFEGKGACEREQLFGFIWGDALLQCDRILFGFVRQIVGIGEDLSCGCQLSLISFQVPRLERLDICAGLITSDL